MAGINKDQIFAVAEELDLAGKSPTLAAVRKALGGGSYTTISEAMTEWKAKKAAKESPLREPAPHAVSEQLNEFGLEIWALALELANGRLASERAALETARAQLEAETVEAAELADQVSAELEAAHSKVLGLESEKAELAKEIQSAKEQLIEANQRVIIAETRAIEIEKRVGDLNSELARVNEQNNEFLRAFSQAQSKKEEK